VRVDEQTFLRYYAGTSLMPALLVWGMHVGYFSDDSVHVPLREIAEDTGYSVAEIYDMCRLISSMLVEETDNETTDIPR
jgi:hypothetical protein